MGGKIFITSSGYDPQLGKHVKDPYLGDSPTLGACRPDIREQLDEGDHIFVVSGKVKDTNQFVMGGFEIERKITAVEAFGLFPDLRLRRRDDGQLTGNIIVDAVGNQHVLDNHNSFDRRIKNYVVGTNLLSVSTAAEIAVARQQTLDALREILQRDGKTPFDLLGRSGARLTERQVEALRSWLTALKTATHN